MSTLGDCRAQNLTDLLGGEPLQLATVAREQAPSLLTAVAMGVRIRGPVSPTEVCTGPRIRSERAENVTNGGQNRCDGETMSSTPTPRVRVRSSAQLVLLAALGALSALLSLGLLHVHHRLLSWGALALLLTVGLLWNLWMLSAISWLRGVTSLPAFRDGSAGRASSPDSRKETRVNARRNRIIQARISEGQERTRRSTLWPAIPAGNSQ